MSPGEVAVVALAITLGATPLVIVAARRTGTVDRPGALKHQATPVPYLGGVAVLAGVAVGAAVGHPLALVPLTMAVALGVADDRVDLPPLVRLAGQIAIGLAVVLTCRVHLPAVPATCALVLVTVLLINGVNLIDGLDMLAAGVVGVASAAFAVLLLASGRQLAVALAAALLGFLVYNRPPARVYLGDGGSYLLGTGLAVLLAAAWAPGVHLQRGVGALALVAIPAAEVAFAMIRRLRNRRSVLHGDRGHPYDLLVAAGWPRSAASLTYVGIEAILAATAVTAAIRGSVAVTVVVDVATAIILTVLAVVSGAVTVRVGSAS